MNSPLESRKVRLRGLGGPAVCGIPGACASAAVTAGEQDGSEIEGLVRTERPMHF
jgi:hypothetical protein